LNWLCYALLGSIIFPGGIVRAVFYPGFIFKLFFSRVGGGYFQGQVEVDLVRPGGGWWKPQKVDWKGQFFTLGKSPFWL